MGWLLGFLTLLLAVILFRPRRRLTRRQVTRSFNGLPYGKEQELY